MITPRHRETPRAGPVRNGPPCGRPRALPGAFRIAPRRARGQFAVEFVLMLMFAITVLFVPVGEMIRISLFDQVLAEATHLAARAAASDPANNDQQACQAAIQDAFPQARLAGLLDQDDSGAVDITFGNTSANPDPNAPAPDPNAPAADVQVGVQFKELFAGDWTDDGCGTPGSLIRVIATIEVKPWSPAHLFWDGVTRRAIGLARNQAG